ncbi:hypothetical protein BO70DRAFT_363321 [Aspergillus heteromorphus CBS 117.55]|uniref:BOD1/SHG1 domain-containing protein n=1 Tax=Aspergillus heteromorphus CBS 117.55 TaxID=1448321 RepID=A0A317VUU7_9EURO|nr:uncharacterized protein BO70DRAFT_363321 [Aspergillus heteromorphus CBS 117.55]PWY77379.1 hypothetical protein BO70DRAFT_363321 [Aspergillus heteromorphus CBS 117.55]
MAGPEEMAEGLLATGVKRPSLDLESLQRKKFKTEELPLSAAQHTVIENLLHSFKKRGGFDTIRKKIWSEFHDGVFFFFYSCLGLWCWSRGGC